MATVEQTMLKVQRILTGAMGLRVELRQDEIMVRFNDVSTAVLLSVKDYGTDDEGEPQTVVMLRAPVLRAVAATSPLFEWVAMEGGNQWFGHIEIVAAAESEQVELWMAHRLLGDYLDEKELATAMYSVLGSADRLDDELQARFGGKRLVDA